MLLIDINLFLYFSDDFVDGTSTGKVTNLNRTHNSSHRDSDPRSEADDNCMYNLIHITLYLGIKLWGRGARVCVV